MRNEPPRPPPFGCKVFISDTMGYAFFNGTCWEELAPDDLTNADYTVQTWSDLEQ